MDPKIIEEYFEGSFQQQLEEAYTQSMKQGEEDNPYEFKYQARNIYTQIVNHQHMKMHEFEEVLALKAQVYYLLGNNCYETEENGQAREYFKKALDFFELLPYEKVVNFLNCLQDIFNANGLLLVNSDQDEEGIGFLGKAFKIYEKIKEAISTTKVTYYNTMTEYNQKLMDFNSGKPLIKKLQTIEKIQPKFSFYYQGGLSLEKTEELFTLSNFYQAQSYTKFGQRDDAAFYCGQTQKRQLDLKEYESKEWCNSSMGLAEYYKSNRNYSQAMYVVFVAMSILPEGRYKKQRASLNIMMGNIMNDFLDYNSALIKCGVKDKEENEIEELANHINKQLLVFDDLKIVFPKNIVHKDMDGIKSQFRMGLTEYKKALTVYVLDGHVTEFVNISKMISLLYKRLAGLETDPSRAGLMLQKRKELIDPIVNAISPKNYTGLWRVSYFFQNKNRNV